MSRNSRDVVHTLDRNGAWQLSKFVTKHNIKVDNALWLGGRLSWSGRCVYEHMFMLVCFHPKPSFVFHDGNVILNPFKIILESQRNIKRINNLDNQIYIRTVQKFIFQKIKIKIGYSPIPTPFALYAPKMTETHGHTYHPHVTTITSKEWELLYITWLYTLLHKHSKPTKCKRFFSFINVGTFTTTTTRLNNTKMVTPCTCPIGICQCLARLRPDILHVVGAPNQSHTLVTPSLAIIIQ